MYEGWPSSRSCKKWKKRQPYSPRLTTHILFSFQGFCGPSLGDLILGSWLRMPSTWQIPTALVKSVHRIPEATWGFRRFPSLKLTQGMFELWCSLVQRWWWVTSGVMHTPKGKGRFDVSLPLRNWMLDIGGGKENIFGCYLCPSLMRVSYRDTKPDPD